MTDLQDPLTNQNLSMLAQFAGEVPLWVKQASTESLHEEVPQSLFAWGKRLPCHSKLATFLSRLYFEIQRDELGEKEAQQIDAKLAGFELQWDIDPKDVASAVGDIRRNKMIPTIEALGNALINKMAGGQALPLGDIVRACRQLCENGSTNPRIQKLAAYLPVKGFKQQIVDLVSAYGGEQSKTAATYLCSLSHKDAQDKFPELLDTIAASVLGPRQFERKVASMEHQEHFDVRLAGYDYPRAQVLKALPKVAAMLNLPVMHGDIDLPVADWEQKIASFDLQTQRDIQRLV